MARPPDWSALDLDNDPTPGDPDRLEALLESQQSIIDLAQDIDDGLDELMKTNSEAFVGETASALREEMDNRVRKFVQSFQEAHQSVHDALTTYRTVLVDQQDVADGALSQAADLDEDDPDRETHRSTAKDAGDALDEAAATAATALEEAASSISSIIDPCEEFWKFLTYFAIALIVPALVLGGPTALLFLAVNTALLVKTAIDFAGGNAKAWELALAVLGMLVPTTKGLNITKAFSTIKTWSTNKAVNLYKAGPTQIAKNLKTDIGGLLTGGWTLGRRIIEIVGDDGLRVLSAKVVHAIYNGLGGKNGFAGYVGAHFTKIGWLGIVAPVNVGEMGAGLLNAFKISLIDRGFFGRFRTGAVIFGGRPIDRRVLVGFDGSGRAVIDQKRWLRYQAGAGAAFRGVGAFGHLFTGGANGAFSLPPIGGLSTLDHFGAGFTPINVAGNRLTAPLQRVPFSSPNVVLNDLAVPPPAGVTTLPGGLPTVEKIADLGLADMRPVQPINVHFADQGLRIGVAGHHPGFALAPTDGLGSLPGDFHLAGRPSVVVNVPAAGGQTIGVEVPLLPTGSTVVPPTSVVNGTPAPVGQSPSHLVDIGGLGSSAPFRLEIGADGLRIVPTGEGRLPAFSLGTMPQLGEMTTLPAAGLSIARGDLPVLTPAALPDGAARPVAPQLPGAGRLNPGEISLDLDIGLASPLRIHFADQGQTLTPPQAAAPSPPPSAVPASSRASSGTAVGDDLGGQAPIRLHLHRSGPLEGHFVAVSPGRAPQLVGPNGQRVTDATLVEVGGLGWAVGRNGHLEAIVDGTGAHTFDVTRLGGRGDARLDQFAAIPRGGGDGTPFVLFRGDGQAIPEPARLVGQALVIQRAPGAVDFHSRDGGLLGSALSLPGEGGHALVIPNGTGRPHVAGPGGGPLRFATFDQVGDLGWLVGRRGYDSVLIDPAGVHTHTVVPLLGKKDAPTGDLAAVPAAGHDGPPLLIRDAEVRSQAINVHPKAGWITVGDGADAVVFSGAGRVLPDVHPLGKGPVTPETPMVHRVPDDTTVKGKVPDGEGGKPATGDRNILEVLGLDGKLLSPDTVRRLSYDTFVIEVPGGLPVLTDVKGRTTGLAFRLVDPQLTSGNAMLWPLGGISRGPDLSHLLGSTGEARFVGDELWVGPRQQAWNEIFAKDGHLLGHAFPLNTDQRWSAILFDPAGDGAPYVIGPDGLRLDSVPATRLGDQGILVEVGDRLPLLVKGSGGGVTVAPLRLDGGAADWFAVPPAGSSDGAVVLGRDGRLVSDDVLMDAGENRVVVREADVVTVFVNGRPTAAVPGRADGPIGEGNVLHVPPDGSRAFVTSADGTEVPGSRAVVLAEDTFQVEVPDLPRGVVNGLGETTAAPPAPAPTSERAAGGAGTGGGGWSVSDLFSGKMWDVNPELAMWRALEELGLPHNAPLAASFPEPKVFTVFVSNGSRALNSADDIPLGNLGPRGESSTTNPTGGVSNVNPAPTQGTPPPGRSTGSLGGSGSTGGPPDSAIVRVSDIGTRTPAPRPRSFDVEGLTGVRFATTFDDAGGVTRVQLIAGTNPPVAATHGVGDPQGVFRAQQALGGGVTRNLSFRVDGDGVELLSMERAANLTDAHFGPVNLRTDDLAAGGPTVTGATRAGGGRVTITAGDTAGTVRLHHDLGGGISRDMTVQLTGAQPTVQAGHRNVDLGAVLGFGGTSLRFNETTGAAPELRIGRGGTAVVPNAVTDLGPHIPGHHLVAAGPNRIVVGANDAVTHRLLPVPGTAAVPGAPAGGHHVFVPAAGTGGGPVVRALDGTALGGVTPHPQVGGGTRFQGGGIHVSVDGAGTRLSQVVELTGHGGATRNVLAHVPVGNPADPAFLQADGTVFAGVTRQANGDFQQVAGNVTSTYHPNGTLIQDVVHHNRGPLVGQNVTAPNGGVPHVGDTQGVAQGTTGTFRVPVPTGPHALVNQAGELTGTAMQFTGRNGAGLNAFGHLPVPADTAPLALHTGNGAGIPAGTVRGGTATLPNPPGNTVHRYDGSLIKETIRVNGGGADLNGRDLVVRPGNTVATITPPGGHRATASATVTEQVDELGDSTGLRLDINGRGLAIDNQGRVTHDVFTLNQPGQPARFAFVDTTNPAGAGLRNADGTPTLHVTFTRLPSGEFTVASPENGIVARFGADGAFQFQDIRLPGAGAGGADQFVRMRQFGHDFGRRSYELLDNNHVVIPDRTVLPRPRTGVNPNPGFRVNGDEGAFRLYRQDGHLDVSVSAPDATTNIRNVTPHGADGGAPTNPRVLELADGVNSRYLDITDATNLRLLDGEMGLVDGHGTIHIRDNGGHRIDGHGARANEWAEYSTTGKMTRQRIDVFHQGRAVGDQHFVIDYTTPGGPTWTRNPSTEAAAPRNPKWFDFGEVDMKGAEHGRVSLLSHSGAPVFERRVLPDGGVLDSHVAAPSLRGGNGVSFGPGTRDHWSEIRADGNLGDFGRRKWSVSGRAWVDYDNAGNPVRHFRENPQGGHVIADMRGMNAHYWSGSTGTWYRFDADYQQVATGTRTWSPGRAWIDTMGDAATGETKIVHQKFGRIAGLDNLRRYTAYDINANGGWSNEWKAVAPTGKEVGGSTAMKNGDLLTIERVAEQRPPNAWRSVLSSEFRGTDFSGDQARWAKDSRMQLARWEQSNGGVAVDHGVQLTSQQGNGVFRISHTGNFVGETRKLTNGNDLKVGADVKLPDGVTLPHRYQPWSEGAGNLEGHRTFNQADFAQVHLPNGSGKTADDVLFVDRFHINRAHADPFSPTADAADWRIARVGFKDGTMLDYRPRPMEDPVGDALDFRRTGYQGGTADWSILDPHGTVVARQDTFGLGDAGVQIRADGPNRWIGADGSGGVRKHAATNDIHYRGWDRHSFQDFDANGQLVREHRLLAKGVTVGGWQVPGNDGAPPTWRWNKIDADGTVRRFGDQDARVRQWFDSRGRLLGDWQPGARWVDTLDEGGLSVRIQEIPAFATSGNPARDALTMKPFRVREYFAKPADLDTAVDADAYRAWKEYDAGIMVREIKRLSDGSFLERETWQKQWRRYVFGTNNTHTVVDERTIPGNVYERDTFGRTHLVGRETHFIDFPNEFRGFTREWREPMRWSWGPSVTNGSGPVRGAESLYTPFIANSLGQMGVELLQEFTLDFLLNLTVFGIVSAVTGTPFTLTDVQQAAFGAAIAGGVKTLSNGLHNWAGHRGTWKVGLGTLDLGNSSYFRTNDDSWDVEFAGNEKVLRWRVGTYDFFKDGLVGGLGGFAGAAAGAAIFGVKDSEGNRHQLSGGDALMYGVVGLAGGLAGTFSVGAIRGMTQNTAAARLYHRAGVIDFLVMPVLSKLIDKNLAVFVLGPAIRESLGIVPPSPDNGSDPSNNQPFDFTPA
ncbi:hypothetical protein [Streptomyces mayteni]